MTKDDKQFFKGLITDLEKKLTVKIDGVDSRLSGVESRLGAVESGQITLVSALHELDTRLTGEIRHNGVLIEKMQNDIDLLVEGNQTFYSKIVRLEEARA